MIKPRRQPPAQRSPRMTAPTHDLATVTRLLECEYRKHQAPIIDLLKAQGSDPFHILVSTLLSARTRDEVTAAVSLRLHPRVKGIEDLQRIPLAQLEDLIRPVGFFRTKARHLKALANMLATEFKGNIPDSIDELCRLPGVGRKTANLVVAVAFNKPAICVDIHVHRISNRLGLIRTRNPHASEMTLRKLLPQEYWAAWNRLLVSFGQTICRPVRPKCGACPIRPHCRRVGLPALPALK